MWHCLSGCILYLSGEQGMGESTNLVSRDTINAIVLTPMHGESDILLKHYTPNNMPYTAKMTGRYNV